MSVSDNDKEIFLFRKVSFIEVRDIYSKLKISNTKDIYGLSTYIVKNIKNILIPPLTKLINHCIVEKVFPECLKKAVAVPIYKKGDENDVNNYRPISLLPIFSKILERLLYNQMIEFLERNKILKPAPLGFKKGFSTAIAVLKFVENVMKTFENEQSYYTHYLDLNKAFDCVSWNILLRKLLFYHFHPSSTKLISSYLHNRTQCVKLNDNISEEACIDFGVPQIFILGPPSF
jgi:hypothetical protein